MLGKQEPKVGTYVGQKSLNYGLVENPCQVWGFFLLALGTPKNDSVKGSGDTSHLSHYETSSVPSIRTKSQLGQISTLQCWSVLMVLILISPR
jgi:hypothetical protein